ncbi:GNAT family N-acetyltransferase, partial [Streptomyces griseus]
MGWFCPRPLRGGPREEAGLGYRLRRPAWGRGYATEVSQALLAKGLARLGIRHEGVRRGRRRPERRAGRPRAPAAAGGRGRRP